MLVSCLDVGFDSFEVAICEAPKQITHSSLTLLRAAKLIASPLIVLK